MTVRWGRDRSGVPTGSGASGHPNHHIATYLTVAARRQHMWRCLHWLTDQVHHDPTIAIPVSGVSVPSASPAPGTGIGAAGSTPSGAPARRLLGPAASPAALPSPRLVPACRAADDPEPAPPGSGSTTP